MAGAACIVTGAATVLRGALGAGVTRAVVVCGVRRTRVLVTTVGAAGAAARVLRGFGAGAGAAASLPFNVICSGGALCVGRAVVPATAVG